MTVGVTEVGLRILFYLFFSVVLGYGAEWAPYYVGLLSNDGDLIILGSLLDYSNPCEVPQTDTSKCSFEYRVPLRTISPQNEPISVGVGAVLAASQFLCSADSKSVIKVYDDPLHPGRSYDTYNSYQTATITPSTCGEYLIIRAWSPVNGKRLGYVSGALVLGAPSAVEQVRRLVEFYNRDVRVLMAFAVVFAFLFFWVSKAYASHDIFATPFERYFPFWVGFLTISSGLAQVVVPILQPLFFSRLSAILSLVAHLGPAVIFCSFAFKRIGYDFGAARVQVSLSILAFGLVMSSYFFAVFAGIAFPVGLLCILAALRTRSPLSGAYGLLLIVAGLKLQNVPFTPNSHVVAAFVSCVLLDSAVGRFSSSRLMWNLVDWVRTIDTSASINETLRMVLGDLSKKLRIGRMTLIRLDREGESNIIVCKNDSGRTTFEEFTRVKTPPVFSHVISSRKALWHVDSESDIHQKIVRDRVSKSGYGNRYYSLIPIEGQSELYGVIAVTDYADDIRSDSVRGFVFESCFRMMSPHIARILETLKDRESATTSSEVVRFQSRIQVLREAIRAGEMADLATLVSSMLDSFLLAGQQGFLADLNDDRTMLNVLAVNGYAEEITDRLINGRIYVDSDNLHGPIPLAVNEKRVIVVSDLDQIAPMLNPITMELLRKSSARSFAAIPIVVNSTSIEGRVVWGVIWMQDSRVGALGARDVDRLDLMSQLVASTIQMFMDHNNQRRFREMLTEFVPKLVVDRLMHGERTKVVDRGLLMMIDLKDSSKVAKGLSAEFWSEFIKRHVSPVVKTIASKHGFTLHQVIWDAFFLTRSCGSLQQSDLQSVIQFHSEILSVIDNLYAENLSTLVDFDLREFGNLRTCFVHGDVTRGFSEGPSPVWTVVGFTMSHVMKLEAECKGLQGTIFTTDDFSLPTMSLELTDRILPLTGRPIVTFEEEIDKRASA